MAHSRLVGLLTRPPSLLSTVGVSVLRRLVLRNRRQLANVFCGSRNPSLVALVFWINSPMFQVSRGQWGIGRLKFAKFSRSIRGSATVGREFIRAAYREVIFIRHIHWMRCRKISDF